VVEVEVERSCVGIGIEEICSTIDVGIDDVEIISGTKVEVGVVIDVVATPTGKGDTSRAGVGGDKVCSG
jgi:hypothetical protein